MKFLALILLPVCLVACNPPGKADEDASTPSPKSAKAATPVPKPGDWMEKKNIGNKLGVKEDRLGVKGNRLDEPVKK